MLRKLLLAVAVVGALLVGNANTAQAHWWGYYGYSYPYYGTYGYGYPAVYTPYRAYYSPYYAGYAGYAAPFYSYPVYGPTYGYGYGYGYGSPFYGAYSTPGFSIAIGSGYWGW